MRHYFRTATGDEDALERILRTNSKTFYFASRALPRRVRRQAVALYAFCRHADDGVDDAETSRSARAAVDALRARIDRVYADRALDDVVERAFARVVRETGIPRSEPDALAEGMEWDVLGRRYATLDELRAYALRVAGTVGVMMTHVMGKADAAILERARDLGIGMQLTNIARDVGADARLGRVYLPLQWLEESGTSGDELLASPRATEPVRRAVARLLVAADGHYASADQGIAHLPSDCRVAIRAARLIYAEIGQVIRDRDFDSISSRAVVSSRRKAALLCRAVGARLWRARPLSSPDEDTVVVRRVTQSGMFPTDGTS
jgi:phytoene synthase